MGFLDSLFGGGDSPDIPETTTQISIPQPWWGVEPRLYELYSYTKQALDKPLKYYPYPTTAAQNPLTTAGQNALLNYAGGPLQSLLGQGQQSLGQMFAAPDVARNPYVKNMINQQRAQVGELLNRQFLPSIRSGAALSGQGGLSSRRNLAYGQAAGDAAQALAGSAAQTQLGAYGQGLDAAARAQAFMPQLAQLGMLPAQLQQQVGDARRAEIQTKINEAMKKWNFAQQEPWDRVLKANQVYSGVPFGSNSTQETSGMDGGGSRVANAVGGGLAGYALGDALAGTDWGFGLSSMLPFMGTAGWGGTLGTMLGLLL